MVSSEDCRCLWVSLESSWLGLTPFSPLENCICPWRLPSLLAMCLNMMTVNQSFPEEWLSLQTKCSRCVILLDRTLNVQNKRDFLVHDAMN